MTPEAAMPAPIMMAPNTIPYPLFKFAPRQYGFHAPIRTIMDFLTPRQSPAALRNEQSTIKPGSRRFHAELDAVPSAQVFLGGSGFLRPGRSRRGLARGLAVI